MKLSSVLTGVLLLFVFLGANAALEPSDPEKQTKWKLYVDSKEAYEMKQKLGDKVLLVDVRDPLEIMFTGYTDSIDVNIPYKLANRTKWNTKKPVFLMELNPAFEKQLSAALEERGLTKDDPVVLMCRSGGTRGAPSANMLWDKGYQQVYVVTDGFEGGSIKSGERKNWRLKNGWKNSELPWSYKLNKEKIYIPTDS